MAFDPTQPFEVVEDPQAQAGGVPRFDPSQAFEVVDDGQTGLIEGVGNSIKRGWTMSQMASEMEKPAPDPQRVAALQQEMQAAPPSAEYMTVMDDRRAPEESWTAFKSDPVKVLAELMGESFSAFAGQMIEKAPNRVAIGLGAGAGMGASVAGIGAVPGGFIGAGAGFAEASGAASYSLEMAGGVLEAMEQAGVPLDNPEALAQALQDPQRMQLAREFAQRKAVPIAIFDGASAVIGGRMFGGGKVTSAMQRLGQGMAETFTQAAMGAAGETSGQIAQSGGITSGRAILAEGVAEIPTGLVEIGAGQLSQAGATANQPTATAPAAAPAAAPQPAPFTPPPAAETVVVEEVFGDPTTAAAEPVAEAAPAFDPSQDFEVVQEPSAPIVTEPPAAPRFQFDLADDTATAPEMDVEADVFAGVPQQQPSEPPAAPKIFRGVSPDVDYSSGDQFWSESREVAENYAAQTGTEGTIDEATPETLPKNLYTATDKPTLKDELELKSEPFAPEFDAEAKTVLQARGFEGIRYESGTDLGGEQAAEFHVFGKPKQQAAQQPSGPQPGIDVSTEADGGSTPLGSTAAENLSSPAMSGKRSEPAAAGSVINLSNDDATILASVVAGRIKLSSLRKEYRSKIDKYIPLLPKDFAEFVLTLPGRESVRGPRVISFLQSQQQAGQQPALVPAPAAPAVESSFAQAFRAAKKTEDKRLAVMKAVADNSFLPAVIDAAESGKPLPNIEKFKDAFPYEGVTLPGRVDLSRVAIKPIKPAAPDIAARSHTAKDSSRFVLEGVYYDAEAQSVVGTDGRRLIAIPQKVEGKSRIISATDGREIQGQFPNWKYIIPKVDKDTILFNVDIDKARRAGTVLSGINKTLKSLAIPAKVKVGMATLDPAYVKDSVEALVASGAKKVYAASKDDASPVMLRGDNGAMAIIMPMRGGKNELVVDASTVIGEVIGNEGREVRQMFTDADPNASAKKSRTRIKKMTAQSGAIDLSIVEDLVEYGKTIYRAGMSFGKWAGQMVKEFGQGIASFLRQAFDRIVQAYKDSPYSDTTGAVGDVRPKAKPRQFEQKAAKAPGISEEARAQMGDDPYVPITLRGVAEQAKAWIAENGIEAAERRILGLADEGQTPTPLDFAIGLELTANLSATGNAGRAAAVVRTMSRRATSLGQTISTLAMLSRLTPEGIVFYANQIIEQHIGSLTPERQAEIRAAQDDVANLEETVATTRKRTAEDAIINGTQGGEKIQDKLKRRIPDKAKKQDTNVSIRSVLTSQATKAEATKQITQILTESGISQSEATALATAITNRFYKVLEDARKALATSRKPAKGKGRATIDKLLTQLKDGKISDQEFVATLGQLVGVPGLTPELRKKLDNLTRQYKAATDDDIALVLAARIFEEVHGLVPADFWVKLRAVSYLSMLFSPRTWIRNLGGNQIQWLTDIGIDSAISMVFDPIASIFTGKRTTAGVYVGTRIKALLAPVQDVIKGYKWNAKQNPSANVIDNIFAGLGHLRVLAKLTTQNKFDIVDAKEVGRRIFSNKFMQLWEGALSIALGGGDRAFWMSGFRASLARREAAAKKNGTWTGQPTPEDVDAAYADAMYAIYQNPNVLSKNSNKIRQALNRLSTFGKTDQFGLGTGLLAFTQVPGSLSLRGLIEMSPLGLVTALYEGMRPVLFKASGGRAGGNFRQEEFNKALSRAMIGSGAFYAGGYYLYAMGIVTGSREEDDDLEAMRRASGMGAYRINVSALKRMLGSGNFYVRQTAQDGDLIVSYDWAQPVAITFAAGAELAKMVEENDRNGIKKGLAGKVGMAAISLAAGAKSLEELPLLSGLSSFMKTWGYSGPLDAVVNTVSGMPSMFVPQLVRQANQLMDNTVRETRGDEGMVRAFSRIAANTPGVADQFPPRMDIMGQAIERYQYGGNTVFNVLINPALTSRVKINPALQEVARLMQTTGEASQAPRQVGRSVAINGENINLSNEQISAYQYYLGNYTMSMFNWRMASPRYARLPDTEKVKLLAQDLEDVNAATKSALFGHDVRRLTRRQRVMRANLVNSPLGQSMPPR
jgi:hypothetical protein